MHTGDRSCSSINASFSTSLLLLLLNVKELVISLLLSVVDSVFSLTWE